MLQICKRTHVAVHPCAWVTKNKKSTGCSCVQEMKKEQKAPPVRVLISRH